MATNDEDDERLYGTMLRRGTLTKRGNLSRPARTTRYTTRQRRQSSKSTQAFGFNRAPGLMDTIQVLWVLDSSPSPVWWLAEVTDIDTTSASSSSAQGSTAATIRYVPKCGYPAQDYDVIFMHSTSGVKKLKHVSPSAPGMITWKYADEPDDFPKDRSSSFLKSPIAKKRQSGATVTAEKDDNNGDQALQILRKPATLLPVNKEDNEEQSPVGTSPSPDNNPIQLQ